MGCAGSRCFGDHRPQPGIQAVTSREEDLCISGTEGEKGRSSTCAVIGSDVLRPTPRMLSLTTPVGLASIRTATSSACPAGDNPVQRLCQETGTTSAVLDRATLAAELYPFSQPVAVLYVSYDVPNQCTSTIDTAHGSLGSMESRPGPNDTSIAFHVNSYGGNPCLVFSTEMGSTAVGCVMANTAAVSALQLKDEQDVLNFLARSFAKDPSLKVLFQDIVQRLLQGQLHTVHHFVPGEFGRDRYFLSMRISPFAYCRDGPRPGDGSSQPSGSGKHPPAHGRGLAPPPGGVSGGVTPAMILELDVPYEGKELAARLQRDYMIISNIPSIVTMFDTSGRVVHQNRSSVAYMGYLVGLGSGIGTAPCPPARRKNGGDDAEQGASVALLSMQVAERCGTSDPDAARRTGCNPNRLQELFAHEPTKLQEVIQAIADGTEWCGLVKMPAKVKWTGHPGTSIPNVDFSYGSPSHSGKHAEASTLQNVRGGGGSLNMAAGPHVPSCPPQLRAEADLLRELQTTIIHAAGAARTRPTADEMAPTSAADHGSGAASLKTTMPLSDTVVGVSKPLASSARHCSLWPQEHATLESVRVSGNRDEARLETQPRFPEQPGVRDPAAAASPQNDSGCDALPEANSDTLAIVASRASGSMGVDCPPGITSSYADFLQLGGGGGGAKTHPDARAAIWSRHTLHGPSRLSSPHNASIGCAAAAGAAVDGFPVGCASGARDPEVPDVAFAGPLTLEAGRFTPCLAVQPTPGNETEVTESGHLLVPILAASPDDPGVEMPGQSPPDMEESGQLSLELQNKGAICTTHCAARAVVAHCGVSTEDSRTVPSASLMPPPEVQAAGVAQDEGADTRIPLPSLPSSHRPAALGIASRVPKLSLTGAVASLSVSDVNGPSVIPRVLQPNGTEERRNISPAAAASSNITGTEPSSNSASPNFSEPAGIGPPPGAMVAMAGLAAWGRLPKGAISQGGDWTGGSRSGSMPAGVESLESTVGDTGPSGSAAAAFRARCSAVVEHDVSGSQGIGNSSKEDDMMMEGTTSSPRCGQEDSFLLTTDNNFSIEFVPQHLRGCVLQAGRSNHAPSRGNTLGQHGFTVAKPLAFIDEEAASEGVEELSFLLPKMSTHVCAALPSAISAPPALEAPQTPAQIVIMSEARDPPSAGRPASLPVRPDNHRIPTSASNAYPMDAHAPQLPHIRSIPRHPATTRRQVSVNGAPPHRQASGPSDLPTPFDRPTRQSSPLLDIPNSAILAPIQRGGSVFSGGLLCPSPAIDRVQSTTSRSITREVASSQSGSRTTTYLQHTGFEQSRRLRAVLAALVSNSGGGGNMSRVSHNGASNAACSDACMRQSAASLGAAAMQGASFIMAKMPAHTACPGGDMESSVVVPLRVGAKPAAAAGSGRLTGAVERDDSRWHEVHVKQCFDPMGSEPIIMVIQTDVTSKVRAEERLARVLEAEHRLLADIFPSHVVQYMTQRRKDEAELEHNGLMMLRRIQDPAAVATLHDCVTVLFADIKGFTEMSKEVAPGVVMTFLNDLYTRFDSLTDVYGVYKVETIGDCYMVAGGLVARDGDGYGRAVRGAGDTDPLHAMRVVAFARAMLEEAAKVALPNTGEPVRVRVGIHSGSVMSGVVGQKMPRFCLFGDTINTASRMESTGRPGAIHVSCASRRLLPPEEDEEVWASTGGVDVKGKGRMETYIWSPQSAGAGRQRRDKQQRALLLGTLSTLMPPSSSVASNTSSAQMRPRGSAPAAAQSGSVRSVQRQKQDSFDITSTMC